MDVTDIDFNNSLIIAQITTVDFNNRFICTGYCIFIYIGRVVFTAQVSEVVLCI